MKRIFLLLLIVLVWNGCNAFSLKDTGSLRISISEESSRLLEPGLSMEPEKYLITGTGPNGELLSVVFDSNSESVSDLVFGEWSIQVTAMNAGGISIYEGSESITVISNETVDLNINISPITGTGTLELDVDWNDNSVQSPVIDAVLTPVTGPARTLDFTFDGSSASFSASDVPAGYYSLSLKLMDNGILTYGAVEMVRILNNQITSGSFVFDNINMAEGTIDFNITVEQDNPITVTLTGTQDQMTVGQILELGASISEIGQNVNYIWYVNGTGVDTGSEYSFSPFESGVYRVDVTAMTIDGKRGGVATCTIEALNPEVEYSIRDIGPAGGYIIYDKGSYSDGWRYIEAASEDLPEPLAWGYYGIDIPDVDCFGVGEGDINTQEILRYSGAEGFPASDCNALTVIYGDNIFDDWFLPADDTLSLFYTVLCQNGLGNFSGTFYWSSSEASQANRAGSIHIGTGDVNWEEKYEILYVRPVRKF